MKGFIAVLNLFGLNNLLETLGKDNARRGARTRWRRTVRLRVQELERREVPASLVYIGPDDGNFGVKDNWGILNDLGTKVPGEGDVLYFDPSLKGNNTDGSNKPAVDNMAGLSVAGLVFGGTYTETVTINQTLTINGSLTFDTGTTGTVMLGQAVTATTLTFKGGTVDGPAGLTINSGGTWTSGLMKGTGTTIMQGGELTIDSAMIDGRTFINTGTVWLDGAINLAGNINNGGVFTVRDGATTIGSAPGQGAFNNLAEFRVEGPALYSFNMGTVFNNYNHTYVSNATLYLRESGSSSGEYEVLNESAKVSFGPFAVGDFVWESGTRFTGNGLIVLEANATISSGATVTGKNFRMRDGNLRGAGTLELDNGMFTWAQGTMSGNGVTKLGANQRASFQDDGIGLGPRIIDGRTLNVHGLVEQTASIQMDNGAVLNINVNPPGSARPKGDYVLLGDVDILWVNGAQSQLNIRGILEKNQGVGTSQIQPKVDLIGPDADYELHTGKIKVTGSMGMNGGNALADAGATIEVTGNFDQTGGTTTVNGALEVGGTYTLSAGTLYATGGGDLDLASFLQTNGSVQLSTASFQVSGNYTMTGGTGVFQSSPGTITGQLAINGGTLNLSNIISVVGGVQIGSGGTLEVQNGTLAANVTNAGTLSLGSRASPYAGDYFTISGNFTQSSTGRLVMDAEAPGGTGYDSLTVSGVANLAGTFKLLLSGDYPEPGNSFIFLTYGSRVGTFGSYDLPSLPSGTWDPRYDYAGYPNKFGLWVI